MKKLYVLCCIIIFSNITYAAPPVLFFTKKVSKKKYFIYKVKKGEYLYEILRKIGVPQNKISSVIKEIKRLNPKIKDLNNLHAGDILKIPKFKNLKISGNGGKTSGIINSGFNISPSLAKQSLKQLKEKYPFIPKKYTVKKGDVLARLLAKVCGIPKFLIYNEYLLIFKKLNPHIKDISSIPVGSSIVLPVYKNFTNSSSEKKSFNLKNYSILFSILKKLGFKVYIKSTFVIPSKNGGWVIVDTSKNPLIETPSGNKIVLVNDRALYAKYEGNIKVILYKSSLYYILKDIANYSKEIKIWEKGENLIINHNQFIVECRGDIQIIKFLNDNTYSYYIFFLSPKKIDYTEKLFYHYLAKHNIFIYTMSMDGTSFVNPLTYIKDQFYVPNLPEDLKIEIERFIKSMEPISIKVKIKKGIYMFIHVYKIGKYYVLAYNSPELIAILRLKGYDCYGF